MHKTPLRYPGGKSKALTKLLPLIPPYTEFREPFLGGGSVFIALKQKYPDQIYWINDLHEGVYHFWSVLRDRPTKLIAEVQRIKDTEVDGRALHKRLISEKSTDPLAIAVRFFVLNRITFSGTVESGGYSEGAFKGRFTQSSIDRLKSTDYLAGVTITDHDYQKLLTTAGTDVFLYLDPPYLSATSSRLYGKQGDLHTGFDHVRFRNAVKNTKHRWLITYDDSPEIRTLFSFANIIPWELQYGMNNYKQKTAAKGKELFITNYDGATFEMLDFSAVPDIERQSDLFL